MQIIVLIDDSEAATDAIQRMREGLTAFVDKLQGRAEIGLVTIGERPTSLVQYTTDTAALKKGIGRLFARPGAGAYLLEGIAEVSRGLEKREPARPVIVAVTTEGVEFSNLQHEQVLKRSKPAARRSTSSPSACRPPRMSRRDAQPGHRARRGDRADRRTARSAAGRVGASPKRCRSSPTSC